MFFLCSISYQKDCENLFIRPAEITFSMTYITNMHFNYNHQFSIGL